jgi:hypothetical protein
MYIHVGKINDPLGRGQWLLFEKTW